MGLGPLFNVIFPRGGFLGSYAYLMKSKIRSLRWKKAPVEDKIVGIASKQKQYCRYDLIEFYLEIPPYLTEYLMSNNQHMITMHLPSPSLSPSPEPAAPRPATRPIAPRSARGGRLGWSRRAATGCRIRDRDRDLAPLARSGSVFRAEVPRSDCFARIGSDWRRASCVVFFCRWNRRVGTRIGLFSSF